MRFTLQLITSLALASCVESKTEDALNEVQTDQPSDNKPLPLSVSQKDLTISSVTDTGFTVSWNSASGGSSPKYRICLSTAAATDSAAAFNAACSSTTVKEWTANLTSFQVTGLLAGTPYYVNVGVTDAAGVVILYTSAKATTTADATGPVLPSNSGLSVSALTSAGAVLNWEKSNDATYAQSTLLYRVCVDAVGSLSSAASIDTECQYSWQNLWSKDLSSISIAGLLPNTAYKANVVVKDKLGNRSLYTATSFQTLSVSGAAYLYVDDSFTITTDTGSVGLSSGDTVTFAPGEPGSAAGLIFGTNAFSTMADALAIANASGSEAFIYIARGTYTGTAQLSATVPISIYGSGQDKTILKPGFNTPAATGVTAAWIIAGSSNALRLYNLKLDGIGAVLGQGIRASGPLIVANCWITDIAYQAGSYTGAGIVPLGPSASITNNLIERIKRIGVQIYSTTIVATYKWNTFKGLGTGDNVSMAMQNGPYLSLTVTENIFQDSLGVASADGSVAGSILDVNSTVPAATAVYSDNIFTSNIYAFYTLSGSVGSISFVRNNMEGVTTGYYRRSTALTLDVSNNWWGSATGPTHAGQNPNGTGSIANDPTGLSSLSSWAVEPF